jgi:hypothetical protein
MSRATQTTPARTTAPATKTYEAKAYAASGARSPLAPATIHRRAVRPHDVQLEVLFCGVCQALLPTLRPVRGVTCGSLCH